MELAIFLNTRFYSGESGYTSDERFHDFWISFAESESIDHMFLLVPVEPNGVGVHPVCLSQKVTVVPLPSMSSQFAALASMAKLSKRLRMILERDLNRVSVVGAVLPSLLGLALLSAAKTRRLSIFGYFRGDVPKTIWSSTQGPRRYLEYVFAVLLVRISVFMLRDSFGFTAGPMLGRKLGIEYCDLAVSDIRIDHVARQHHRVLPAQRPFRILYVGRLSKEKGVHVLLQAFDIVEMATSATLTIAGSGPESEQIATQAAQLKKKDSIELVGNVDRGALDSFYRTHDLLIIPSFTEGLPNVLLEGFSHGIPVISSRVGGIPDMVAHGESACLVEPGDADQLASEIEAVLNSPDLYEKLSEGGLRLAQSLCLENQREKALERIKKDRVSGE